MITRRFQIAGTFGYVEKKASPALDEAFLMFVIRLPIIHLER